MELPWVGGKKIYFQHLGHMTKMPIYGKNPSKIFFSGSHETWYVAFGTPVYHSLIKWRCWVDLDLFYRMVKFCNLGFSIGKSENSGFFLETIAACDHVDNKLS